SPLKVRANQVRKNPIPRLQTYHDVGCNVTHTQLGFAHDIKAPAPLVLSARCAPRRAAIAQQGAGQC
ncbi:hypothetical protein, partial [Xanthomonas oryzae]